MFVHVFRRPNNGAATRLSTEQALLHVGGASCRAEVKLEAVFLGSAVTQPAASDAPLNS